MQNKRNILMPMAKDLMNYCQSKLAFQNPPSIEFAQDKHNADVLLGKTAYYSPEEKKVVVFITNRHPKDVLRSLAHELVHHDQNCRGEFATNGNCGQGYAQSDPHLRNMEKEAYLKGNMLFRDWEDGIKLKISEKKTKENRLMNEETLKSIIKDELQNIILEGNNIEDVDEGLLDRIRSRIAGAGSAIKGMAGNIKKAGKYVGTGDAKDLEGGTNTKDAYRRRKADSMIKSAVKRILAVQKDLTNDLIKTGLLDKQGKALNVKGAEDVIDGKLLTRGLGSIKQGVTHMIKAASAERGEELTKMVNPETVKEEKFDMSQSAGTGDIRKTGVELGRQAGATGMQPKERGLIQQVVKKLTSAAQKGDVAYDVNVRRSLRMLDAALDKIMGGDPDRELAEGGAAQRQGNEDRLRRQEPDRVREDSRDKKEDKKQLKEGSMKKTSRFQEKQRVKHVEDDDLGIGTVVSRGPGNRVQVKWSSGQQESHDHNMLKPVNQTNEEDLRIPENADALNEALYGNRRAALNKRLMEWAKK